MDQDLWRIAEWVVFPYLQSKWWLLGLRAFFLFWRSLSIGLHSHETGLRWRGGLVQEDRHCYFRRSDQLCNSWRGLNEYLLPWPDRRFQSWKFEELVVRKDGHEWLALVAQSSGSMGIRLIRLEPHLEPAGRTSVFSWKHARTLRRTSWWMDPESEAQWRGSGCLQTHRKWW